MFTQQAALGEAEQSDATGLGFRVCHMLIAPQMLAHVVAAETGSCNSPACVKISMFVGPAYSPCVLQQWNVYGAWMACVHGACKTPHSMPSL